MITPAIVFGASSGIGLAVTKRLSQRGKVFAVSRRGTTPGLNTELVKPFVCDIRDYKAVSKVFKTIEETSPGTVINCAGVGAYAPLDDDYSDYWQEILDVNILGCLNILSNVLRSAPNCRDIIIVGSLAAYRPSKTVGNDVYAASKAAVIRIVEDYRRHLHHIGRTMRVTLISPGFVEGTDFGLNYFRSAPDKEQDLYAAFQGLSSEDVADLIEHCLDLPDHMDIGSLIVRPIAQPD